MFDQILKKPTYAELMATPATNGQYGIDLSTNTTYQHNGTVWLPLSRVSVKPSTVSINALTNNSATLIYTLENNPLNFVPVDIVPVMTSRTGAIVTQPVITVGTNAPNYDNIATGSLLGNVLPLLGIGTGSPTKASTSPLLAGGSQIYAKVGIGAIGPSVLTYTIDIVGYYKA